MVQDSYEFNNIKIFSGSLNRILHNIDSKIQDKQYICMIEASGIMRAQKDKNLFKAFKNSFMNIPDGVPVTWYGKLIGAKDVKRISGVQLLAEILEHNAQNRQFLLGDTDDTINRIIKIAKVKNPNLKISGYSPPFKDKFTEQDNELMLQHINSTSSEIIWVSFGLGKQERWMLENYKRLKNGVMIGVGAAFRYYTGDIWIPPRFVQNMGMQWTSRLIERPGEYLKENLFERIKFLYLFAIELIKFKLIT